MIWAEHGLGMRIHLCFSRRNGGVWRHPRPISPYFPGGASILVRSTPRPEAGEKLAAYCWADQKLRIDNAEKAIALARRYPPPTNAGDAADWVERCLAEPREKGVLRILYHTTTPQYLPVDGQARVKTAAEEAGARASEERPLGWISLELPKSGKPVELRLKLWPPGESIHLANSHPHATWIEWLA